MPWFSRSYPVLTGDLLWTVADVYPPAGIGPDFASIACRTLQGDVLLLDLQTGSVLARLPRQTQGPGGLNLPTQLVYSPNGQYLLNCGANGSCVYSLQDRSTVWTSARLFNGDWSPDSNRIAGAYDTGRQATVAVIRIPDGTVLTEIEGYYVFRWSPAGDLGLGTGGGRGPELISTSTRDLIWHLDRRITLYAEMGWSPDGRWIAVGAGTAVWGWLLGAWIVDGHTGRIHRKLRQYEAEVASLAWTADSARLAMTRPTRQNSYTVMVHEAQSGRVLSDLSGPTGGIYALRWDPSGRTLYGIASTAGDPHRSIQAWRWQGL